MTKNFVSDVGQLGGDKDFIKSREPHKAPEGQRFIVFGRVDRKYFGGNAWGGLDNMRKEIDWYIIQPAMIVNQLPDGIGWLYRIKREKK